MKVQLGSFLQEVSDKTTKNDQHPVLTSSKAGLFLQSDYFSKQVASRDNTGYKIIRRGQFTYRAMSDTGEFFPNMLECTDIGIVSPAYPVFEISNPDIILPEYLKYFFKSDAFQYSISAFAQGSTRTSVKYSKLQTVTMPLPCIAEQKKAVDILENAQELIINQKKLLTAYDTLIKARFVEMFGDINNPYDYKESTVKEYCQMTQGVQIPMSEQITKYRIGYCRYLYIRDLKYNNNDTMIYVLDKYNEKKLTKNDLVVVNTGNTAGEIYMGKEGILSNNLFKLSFDTHVLSKSYLYYFFRTSAFQKLLWNEMKEGTQPHLGHKIFGNKKIIIPPIELQEQFSIFIAQIDKSKAVVQQALAKDQLLFDSLMQQYFG